MVHFAALLATAFLSGVALGIPLPQDSSINEPAFSAPNGILLSDVPTQIAIATSSTAVQLAAATTTASPARPPPPPPPPAAHANPPSYGSGSSNRGSGYDDCVSKCMATYGRPPSTYTPPTATHAVGVTGTGATHTIIVAPTQGVLRYVPFAVNASIGDTIKFVWGANNHTVTRSSALLPCNKTENAPFTSGRQDKDFIFTQVVTTTEPTFFHCGVATHCQRGMFGIINPPSALTSSTSIRNAIPAMAASNPDVGAMVAYANQKTVGNTRAANWGNSIDMSKLPAWSHQVVAENTLYTRTFLAANPDILTGESDINTSGPNPVLVPQDITAALSAMVSNSTTGSAAPASGTSETAVPTGSVVGAAAAAASSTAATSGAAQLASPHILLAVAAVVVTFLAL